MICAPSALSWLPPRLQTRAKSACQGLLTVGIQVCGGALEVLERRVRLEGLGEVLCALWTDIVSIETASKGQIALSGAADSRNRGMRQRT